MARANEPPLQGPNTANCRKNATAFASRQEHAQRDDIRPPLVGNRDDLDATERRRP